MPAPRKVKFQKSRGRKNDSRFTMQERQEWQNDVVAKLCGEPFPNLQWFIFLRRVYRSNRQNCGVVGLQDVWSAGRCSAKTLRDHLSPTSVDCLHLGQVLRHEIISVACAACSE
jgi:hypothetical protein